MNRIASYLASVITVAMLGVATNNAHAGSNAPGIVLKSALSSDAGCLSRHTGFADIRNNCTRGIEVIGFLPVLTEGWYKTRLVIYGNNSWCQSATTNGVGNGSHIGALAWTAAGPQTWQTLNLGDRYVWASAALVFRCGLEPGGVIGEYGTDAA